MTKEEFAQKIKEIEAFNAELDLLNEHLGALCPGGIGSFGGKFMDDYIRLLSQVVGDEGEWTAYYVWDCEFGKKPLSAGYEGKLSQIDSIDKLWGLIQESRKRA